MYNNDFIKIQIAAGNYLKYSYVNDALLITEYNSKHKKISEYLYNIGRHILTKIGAITDAK